MTRPEMLEGNLLIGQFMDDGISRQIQQKNVLPLSTAEIWVETRNYHKDWNKLMPVVEKIEELGYALVIYPYECYWLVNNTGNYLFDNTFMGNRLTSVWLAVVEFIKWYNAQNK